MHVRIVGSRRRPKSDLLGGALGAFSHGFRACRSTGTRVRRWSSLERARTRTEVEKDMMTSDSDRAIEASTVNSNGHLPRADTPSRLFPSPANSTLARRRASTPTTLPGRRTAATMSTRSPTCVLFFPSMPLAPARSTAAASYAVQGRGGDEAQRERCMS